MTKPTFYITTPIYYPSGKLHIGHSYTTVAADAMARYKRMRGYDVMFLTGTDEHGQKIQRTAEAQGISPQAFVDKMLVGINALWKLLDIQYDRFIRTTDPQHVRAIQTIFTRLHEKGDIYKSQYEGLYCTPCEAFFTESQLVDGHCPDCGGPVELTQEESYFFRLSKYTDRLIAHYQENPEFVQPVSRANEMLNNFLLPGLEDLAVSRTSFDWGVPVPFDPKHVVYVWVDALSNYITALNYPDTAGDFARYWPADVHLVGKEIVRFHTIIWPAILMALDLPLPKQVFGHGWLLFKEGKMSKSKGNVIEPEILCEKYGVDAIRYFLLREIPFGSDGNFSNEALISRINSDLANDLGNLVSRTTAMIGRYFPQGLPAERETGQYDDELLELAGGLQQRVAAHLDQMQFSQALIEIFNLVSRCNKYIDETMPWKLAKEEGRQLRLGTVLYNLADCLRLIAVLISPFMTTTPQHIRTALGLSRQDAASGLDLSSWESAGKLGLYQTETGVQKGSPLFPRIDLEKEIAELDALQEKRIAEAAAAAAALVASSDAAPQEKDAVAAGSAPQAPSAESAAQREGVVDVIDMEQFNAVKLRVGHVLSCEKLPKSDKLLSFQVDLGYEVRTILSGIADWYQPETLVGKQVVVVDNLAPRKIRGTVSHGMILSAATADGGFRILTVDDQVPAGAEIS